MIVVSDTSPLINLAWIGRLDLLHAIHNQILIPEAVWQEAVLRGEGRPGTTDVAAATWITTHQIQNTHLVLALRQDLDAGEAEAIALAVERAADLLIMDERLGRETAAAFGLRPLGTLGVLVAAKRQGLLNSIKSEIDALRQKAGFYLSDALYRRVLADANE
jgi:hypothetical protein